MDWGRHDSGVRRHQGKAPDGFHHQGPDAPSAHRRPGYPLSGCVPAEPDSVSPGSVRLASTEQCGKPPSDTGVMPQKILLSRCPTEKWPKVTHSLGRRALIISRHFPDDARDLRFGPSSGQPEHSSEQPKTVRSSAPRISPSKDASSCLQKRESGLPVVTGQNRSLRNRAEIK